MNSMVYSNTTMKTSLSSLRTVVVMVSLDHHLEARDLMKQVLKDHMHYIDTAHGETGVNTHYWISRVGFYMICMAPNKQNAIYYRQQFGEVYEFALNYVHTLQRRSATAIQYYKVSETQL